MDEYENDSDSDSDGSDQSQWSDPEEYFLTREAFGYSSPPQSANPMNITFPALLVWENTHPQQVWLALDSDSPFAIYYLQDVAYTAGESRQYPTWIFWLEGQLRKMHRAARNRGNSNRWLELNAAAYSEPPVSQATEDALALYGPMPALEDVPRVSDDEKFRSRRRYEELWTAEDELIHRSMGIYVPGKYAKNRRHFG
ncbi:hypothetical protein C8R47DRAFT_1128849 [Mycena vitilis]|nr:hypothetical protein C8R47DRAFT_1128849 [Mycena vitilis]